MSSLKTRFRVMFIVCATFVICRPPLTHADTFTYDAASAQWLSAPGVEGPETFNASFEWDVTTNTIVPGTVSCSTTGTLGPCTGVLFSNVYAINFGLETGGFIQIFAQDFYISHQPLTLFGVPGDYPHVEMDLLTASGLTYGDVRVTAAPEPGSATIILIGVGLLGLMAMRKGRVHNLPRAT